MSEKGGRWTNVEFVTSLMMSFYNELKGDGLSKEKKDAIEVRLRGQGFEDVTWNGIRLLDAASPLSTFSLVDPPYSSSRSSSSSFITRLFQIATMSRHYQKWTPEIDQQILAAMVKVMIPTAEQYNAIMEELEPCGYGFTAITMK
ncbi:hypothetical protein K4K60_013097 [Colletotrichum sp. SAR11_57]|nr:hypothetical protein K4K60_013097 [Colletotrichum sp. SAR11_57]